VRSFTIGIVFFILLAFSMDAKIIDIDTKTSQEISKRFGKQSAKRIHYLNSHFESKKQLYKAKNIKVLEEVNKFYNRLTYLKDIDHWRKDDYWATLIEFVATGAGDSEDFAMAKLYTLLYFGFSLDKFELMQDTKKNPYAKIQDDEHIVLVYKHTPTSRPIMLDSVYPKLKIIKEKNRLIPIKKSKWIIKKTLQTMTRYP